MKTCFPIVTCLILMLGGTASAQSEKFSRVRIYLDRPGQLEEMISHEILIEHFTKAAPNSIDIELSATDLRKLKTHRYRFDVLVDDVKADYLQQLQNSKLPSPAAPACGLQHFSYGTMGPYHTFDEIVANLDSMKSKYPNLITSKFSIGTSIEGRTLWAVKVSDNPDSNEVASESTVYYDALHHAREPHSMEVLLYYMWWLLENYGTDPEATYLVENRQVYFVPCVNPDGYVYNQTTDPNGGGNWRKNRRNSGGGNFGVDLNRNYSSGFGNTLGASANPGSNTYHGDSAFSEPETRAVRDFVFSIGPGIMFSIHTSGQKYLVSPACNYPHEDYESYAEFSSEFINNTFDGYGTTEEMLGYSSCGTTRHFFHDNGIYAFTPELGNSFWEPQSSFCNTIQNVQGALRYLSFVSGSYPRLNDFNQKGKGYVVAGDTLEFDLRIKNRGLTAVAGNVTAEVTSLTSNCTAIDSVASFGNMNPRSFASGSFRFSVSPAAQFLDSVVLQITIRENGFISHQGTKSVLIGKYNLLFADDGESGMANWTSGTWDTTFMDMQSGAHCFADTRYGNYGSSDTRIITLVPSIKLPGATNPRILFNAKWSMEIFDTVELQASINGTSWNTLATYTQHQHWVQNRVDLSAYIGQLTYLRFLLDSDNGVQSDGLYFDDFRVVDYVPTSTSVSYPAGAMDIRVFPNPAGEALYIQSDLSQSARYEIIHCTGQTIRAGTLSKERDVVYLSGMAPGIYFLRVTANGLSAARMVVKQ